MQRLFEGLVPANAKRRGLTRQQEVRLPREPIADISSLHQVERQWGVRKSRHYTSINSDRIQLVAEITAAGGRIHRLTHVHQKNVWLASRQNPCSTFAQTKNYLDLNEPSLPSRDSLRTQDMSFCHPSSATLMCRPSSVLN